MLRQGVTGRVRKANKSNMFVLPRIVQFFLQSNKTRKLYKSVQILQPETCCQYTDIRIRSQGLGLLLKANLSHLSQVHCQGLLQVDNTVKFLRVVDRFNSHLMIPLAVCEEKSWRSKKD